MGQNFTSYETAWLHFQEEKEKVVEHAYDYYDLGELYKALGGVHNHY